MSNIDLENLPVGGHIDEILKGSREAPATMKHAYQQYSERCALVDQQRYNDQSIA